LYGLRRARAAAQAVPDAQRQVLQPGVAAPVEQGLVVYFVEESSLHGRIRGALARQGQGLCTNYNKYGDQAERLLGLECFVFHFSGQIKLCFKIRFEISIQIGTCLATILAFLAGGSKIFYFFKSAFARRKKN
jgi:hypothetical protein